ncbi:MAG: PQQ-binding-like beta-propeller repeat protein [Candidatus Acidiferrales bacterium]|jgi:quinoprotein glucose dehydrogenase
MMSSKITVTAKLLLPCWALASGFALSSGAARGQSRPQNDEWPTYGGDLGNTRYRPFDQINAANFNTLEVAWRFKVDNLGPRPEYKLEGTPLMVHGVLYATGGSRRAVVALDAATGEMRWVHSENEGTRGDNAPRDLSGRGLAYWTDGKQERILYVTPGYRLIALDAKTGNHIASFGENGVVDLKLNDDQNIDLETGEIGLESAPVVARDVVIIGAAFTNSGTPKSKHNNRGYVRGFDVRTGKRLWIFHTIPLKGEFGYDTWEKDSAEYTGNAGAWTQVSVDEDLGLAYLPVELPTGDYYGGDRPGNGLFGETLVAVDLKTGDRKWHYQLVHHGMWDFDISCAPLLADIRVDGRTIQAVAQASKQGFLYVFDRETGQPVWPIVERPVEVGHTPGEWYSPTQPFPTKPPAFSRNGVSIDDLIDFTPELRKEAMTIVSKYHIGPVFTPAVVSKPEGPIGTLGLGTAAGGANWGGSSYDPDTHMLYVHACNACLWLFGLIPPPSPAVSEVAYIRGVAESSQAGGEGGGRSLTVKGLPLIKPPYGTITAIDLDKGEIVWQIAHGDTPDTVRNNPALKDLKIPRTGQTANPSLGTLVTKTLVIAGDPAFTTTPSHPRGAILHAYGKATGQEVGAVFMPAPQTGSPMTYMLNGRQYIVIAIGGSSYSGEYIAFRLPEHIT